MNLLANENHSKGPTDKLCPSEEPKEAMATKGPDGKDGSHFVVENTNADQSRCTGLAFKPNLLNEPFQKVRLMLGPNHERNVSTRDRPARTGADARIEGSGATAEVRLALRPYGSKFKQPFLHHL